jgi:hypothetical protein
MKDERAWVTTRLRLRFTRVLIGRNRQSELERENEVRMLEIGYFAVAIVATVDGEDRLQASLLTPEMVHRHRQRFGAEQCFTRLCARRTGLRWSCSR